MITKKGNKEGNNVRGEKKIQAKVLIEEKKKYNIYTYIYCYISKVLRVQILYVIVFYFL